MIHAQNRVPPFPVWYLLHIEDIQSEIWTTECQIAITAHLICHAYVFGEHWKTTSPHTHLQYYGKTSCVDIKSTECTECRVTRSRKKCRITKLLVFRLLIPLPAPVSKMWTEQETSGLPWEVKQCLYSTGSRWTKIWIGIPPITNNFVVIFLKRGFSAYCIFKN